MGIMPGRRTRRELQALTQEFANLKQTMELQALIIDDITAATTAGSKKYVGNVYRDYLTTIKEIAAKYEGTAEWGALETGNIIDVRAAFIIGQGVAAIPVAKEFKKSKEMEFIKAFFDYNGIDREMAQEFAKEAEIEGCFLGQLFWDDDDKQVSLRFLSRVDKAYTIVTDPKDYSWYQQATWTEGGSTTPISIKEPEFVYARFGGRVHRPNKPMPKIGKCLTQIEAIDKALRDWREINNLFATPVPTIECKDAADAKAMDEAASKINWKLRKMISLAGRLIFATPDLKGVESLENEIITNAKMVSGTTGVPIGFMGFGDLTTKLGSGSEIASDQIMASTSKERSTSIGMYTEIVTKAMEIWNQQSGLTKLDPSRVKVVIPFVTETIWKRLAEFWLPVYLAEAISLQTFLAQIPGLDVEDEIAKQDEKSKTAMERFSKSNLNSDKENQGEEEENAVPDGT